MHNIISKSLSMKLEEGSSIRNPTHKNKFFIKNKKKKTNKWWHKIQYNKIFLIS